MLLGVGEVNQWNRFWGFSSLLPFRHEHHEISLDFSGIYCMYDRNTANVVRGPGNPGLTCSLECGTDWPYFHLSVCWRKGQAAFFGVSSCCAALQWLELEWALCWGMTPSAQWPAGHHATGIAMSARQAMRGHTRCSACCWLTLFCLPSGYNTLALLLHLHLSLSLVICDLKADTMHREMNAADEILKWIKMHNF